MVLFQGSKSVLSAIGLLLQKIPRGVFVTTKNAKIPFTTENASKEDMFANTASGEEITNSR